MSKNTQKKPTISRARTLADVAVHTILEPLDPSDQRYVDLSRGRSLQDLQMLRQYLENCRNAQLYAVATLTGHRGCGKSTELRRMVAELDSSFESIYVVVDPAIEESCDYADLFLWLASELTARLERIGRAPNEKVIDEIVSWFSERYIEKEVLRTAKKEVEAEANAGGGISLLGMGVKLLAKVKSIFSSSQSTRETSRRTIEQYADQIVGKLNMLLNEVSRSLGSSGRRKDLLIVVDNLDRLQPAAGRRLFISHGELLKRLHAHVIYTVPVAIAVAPDRVSRVFEHGFNLPTIDPAKRDGIKSLVKLLDKRIDIKTIFSPPKLVEQIARMSGGNPRDLIRLLSYAQLHAQVTNGKQIDAASIEAAVTRLRNNYKDALVPAASYFPLLARIHLTASDGLDSSAAEDDAKAQTARDFLRQLLSNGAVLEYNGGDTRFVVHPVVQQLAAFRNALPNPTSPNQ